MMYEPGRDVVAGIRAMARWLIGSSVRPRDRDQRRGGGHCHGRPLVHRSDHLRRQRTAGHHPDARRRCRSVAVVVTALVINLRLVLYSAAMASFWRGTPLWWRLLGGYLLVDPSFVVGFDRYAADPDRRRGHAHYLGGAVVLWVGWLVAIAVGATAGAHLPDGLHLELLVPLFLIGEIVPKLRERRTRRATLVSAAVAVACLAVPLHLGMAVGIVAGMAVGLAPVRTTPTPGGVAAEEVHS